MVSVPGSKIPSGKKKSNWMSLNFRRDYNSINELLSESQGNNLQKEELAKSLWELRLLYDSKWNLVLIIDDALVVGISHSGNSLKKKKKQFHNHKTLHEHLTLVILRLEQKF